jgi:sugar phosphate isomerase/epimerase
MLYSRRDVGRLALASLPFCAARSEQIDSKIGGVRIGAISYSFNTLEHADPMAIVKAFADIRIGECELMSEHCEVLAGAPSAILGRQTTPQQMAAVRAEAQAKLAAWRAATTPATWQAVTRKFNDAGVTVAILCYNMMNDRMTDEDIEYGFRMAEGVGAEALTTSTTLSMAKRIAPAADRHKFTVGYHGHDQTGYPNETASLESYDTLMGYGKYSGIDLDIGHFTASNYDAVDFITKHHDKITSVTIRDRKKDHGPGVFPWGAGDTPIKAVMQLMKKNQYPFPAILELEGFERYSQDVVALGKECFAYVRNCLA